MTLEWHDERKEIFLASTHLDLWISGFVGRRRGMNTSTSPRVYVGTYAKYNNGNLTGSWLALSDYADREAFLEAARELHKDESDPELMFQDFEGFPRSFYGESEIKSDLWEWLELSDDDKELLSVYLEEVNQDGDIDAARDAFMGTANSEADWAETYLEETCGLEGVPAHLRNYIDFEAYARDAQLGGDVTFVRHQGEVWVFRSN